MRPVFRLVQETDPFLQLNRKMLLEIESFTMRKVTRRLTQTLQGWTKAEWGPMQNLLLLTPEHHTRLNVLHILYLRLNVLDSEPFKSKGRKLHLSICIAYSINNAHDEVF